MGMTLIETSPPAELPVPLDDMRAHLRLATGFDENGAEDELMQVYLRAATATVEARTGLALITRAMLLTVDTWDRDAGQALPLAPVARVTAVSLVRSDETVEPVGEARWRLASDARRPVVVPRGGLLPALENGCRAEIAFEAGFGAVAPEVPADLRQAVAMLAARYFEDRAGTGDAKSDLPFAVQSLLAPYRRVRI